MCKVKICIDNKDVVMDDECIYDVERVTIGEECKEDEKETSHRD